MIASFQNRRFQVWEYRVSHGSLLVRSPRGPENETNVDLIFVGVEFMSVPRHLNGIELHVGGDADVRRATEGLGYAVDAGQVFALISGGRRHVIVAAGQRVTEHGGDIFDSPFN
ncbi:hypothetical protein ACQPXM_07650 [Kribbella sp. CA-253562]|uniref:hypothetical protein n=1 Tax=Kribbella sp. CA-253562 TaxID=3239942 RepID=UPI003D8A35F6